MASSEYVTLVNCANKIEIALKSDMRGITYYLHKHGFINQDICDQVIDPKSLLSPTDKAGKLLSIIKGKVDLNPQNYHTFLYYLRRNYRMHGDIINLLDKEYKNLEASHEEQTEPTISKVSSLTSQTGTSTIPGKPIQDFSSWNSRACKIQPLLELTSFEVSVSDPLTIHCEPIQDLSSWNSREPKVSNLTLQIVTSTIHWEPIQDLSSRNSRACEIRPLLDPTIISSTLQTGTSTIPGEPIQDLSPWNNSWEPEVSSLTLQTVTSTTHLEPIQDLSSQKPTISKVSTLQTGTLTTNWKPIQDLSSGDNSREPTISKVWTLQTSTSTIPGKPIQDLSSWDNSRAFEIQPLDSTISRVSSLTWQTSTSTIPGKPIQDLSSWDNSRACEIQPLLEPTIISSTLQTGLYSDEEVKLKIKELQNEFEDMQIEIQDILEEKGITLKHIASCFPGGVQLNSFRSLKKVSGDVNIDDVFSILNVDMAWSFLDFYLLEHIVSKYASNDLKKRMENYSQEVADFRSRTTVYSLINVLPDPNMPSQVEECKTMFVRLNLDPAICTLERLEKIRTSFCKLTKGIPLSETALVLYHLGIGSVIVIWIVRTDLVQTFKEAFTHCVQEGTFFKENSIINLELEGDIFMTMEKMLLEASKEGDIQKVDGVLKKWNHKRHNINETDEDGKTALILSSEQGYNGVVVSLLEEEGISINYQTENEKWSALFFACKNGHNSTVRLLVEYGADTKLKDKDGKTAPIKKKRFQTLVKTTLKLIKEPIRTIKKALSFKKDIFHVCEVGDYARVRRLVEEEKVDVNLKDTEYKEWTPLMWACEKGHFEIIKFLIQHKADISATAMNGWTALHIACSNNFVRIVNFLLKHGADPNSHISKKTNYTALMWISNKGYMEIARSLLKHGADIEVPAAKNGWTALIIASDKGDKDLVQLYLEYGANPNRQGKKGWTALMAAARRGNGEVVKILIKHGVQVDMTMTDTTGQTALHIASYMGNAEVVRVLHEGGADVNIENEAGLTALMIATNRRKNKVVEVLLESKTIDVNIPQKDTQLPALFLSAMNGDEEIFEKLRQHGANDEVDSVHVSDVARQFKQKKITALLEKHKVQQEELQEVKQQHPSTVGPVPPGVPENTATAPIQPALYTFTVAKNEEKIDDATYETSSLYDAEEIVQTVSPQPPGPGKDESKTAKGAKQELSSSREKAQILRKMNAEERMLLYMKIFKEHEQSVSNFDSSDLNEESEKTVKSVSYSTSITELQQEHVVIFVAEA